jgi:hypothetical protein
MKINMKNKMKVCIDPKVFACFGQLVSTEGRVFFSKKRHALLDKSSIFYTGIHPRSAKKVWVLLKFKPLYYDIE